MLSSQKPTAQELQLVRMRRHFESAFLRPLHVNTTLHALACHLHKGAQTMMPLKVHVLPEEDDRSRCSILHSRQDLGPTFLLDIMIRDIPTT